MKKYDTSWDDDNEDAWDEKYEQWEERDWESWLINSLTLPFTVIRKKDDRDFRPNYNSKEPFTIGHTFDIEGIELEDELYGYIVQAREGGRKGHVPLCDVEVTSREDPNFWPVREYVVWFANR